MLHLNDNKVLDHLFEGNFGLEKESFRITPDGDIAQSDHPFASEHIVRDFSEAQTEINTPAFPTVQQACRCCEQLTMLMEAELYQKNELLWPFSNPPIITNEDHLPILRSDNEQAVGYRHYLANRYGKRKMTFCGIHYNFSFSDELLQAEFACSDFDDFQQFQNHVYLNLAAQAARYGWLINVLMNASPLLDGSYYSSSMMRQTCFTGFSSVRNSVNGYWNFFVPVFDYSTMDSYVGRIEYYLDNGFLIAPRELYYPIRIKPKGKYSLEALRTQGADHIELRMLDLNPFVLSGISLEDAQFIHLFLIWLAAKEDTDFSWRDQMLAEHNFKEASCWDPGCTHISMSDEPSEIMSKKALDILNEMESFFDGLCDWATDLIGYQKQKLTDPQNCSYARRVAEQFPDFAREGLEWARLVQLHAALQLHAMKDAMKQS